MAASNSALGLLPAETAALDDTSPSRAESSTGTSSSPISEERSASEQPARKTPGRQKKTKSEIWRFMIMADILCESVQIGMAGITRYPVGYSGGYGHLRSILRSQRLGHVQGDQV